jgi:hypothetical protein
MKRPPTIFLLSPASVTGLRAKQMMSPRAQFAAAQMFRSEEGVPIADAFEFMSALYFRGKIAYARTFAAPPKALSDHGIFVITPGFGLVPPDWPLNSERWNVMRKTPIDIRNRRYRNTLEDHARILAQHLTPKSRVVLLGSIATGKYVDILWPIFGSRLLFPRSFVGLGDMSRGAIMLRAARTGEELEYATLDIPRHRKRDVKLA